jgi:hypothetical protein
MRKPRITWEIRGFLPAGALPAGVVRGYEATSRSGARLQFTFSGHECGFDEFGVVLDDPRGEVLRALAERLWLHPKFEVVGPIVGPNPVLVVDVLERPQWSAERALHHHVVFVPQPFASPPMAYAYQDVASLVLVTIARDLLANWPGVPVSLDSIGVHAAPAVAM